MLDSVPAVCARIDLTIEIFDQVIAACGGKTALLAKPDIEVAVIIEGNTTYAYVGYNKKLHMSTAEWRALMVE